MIVAVLLGMALADHHHPPQDAAIHEQFYSDWMRPDAPTVSCCGLKDCYPTSFKLVGRAWYAQRREDGEWIPVPSHKFERRRDSPDGRNHVCMQAPGNSNTVFCAILGEGM
jgi:hypothetical protein